MLGLSFRLYKCEGLPWTTQGLLQADKSQGRAIHDIVSQDRQPPSRHLSVMDASGSVTQSYVHQASLYETESIVMGWL